MHTVTLAIHDAPFYAGFARFFKMSHDEDLIRSTAHYLCSGGDERIALGKDGRNLYGCSPLPDHDLHSLGFTTASTISESGMQSASLLLELLLERPSMAIAQCERQRSEIAELSGANLVAGSQVLFAPSGTDVHRMAAHLARINPLLPLTSVMVQASETGSSVKPALQTMDGAQCLTVDLRNSDGSLKTQQAIDSSFVSQMEVSVAKGHNCLLVLTDLTKTGLLAPSPQCAVDLKKRWPEKLTVLVDACQMRLSPNSVASYLAEGFLVAITGSKFVGGPAFCGALLIPADHADVANEMLEGPPNVGLMLRWEAALSELVDLRSLGDTIIKQRLQKWGNAVRQRIHEDPAFEELAVRPLESRQWANRRFTTRENDWDSLQSIFSFVLRGAGRQSDCRALNLEETRQVYLRMSEPTLLSGLSPDVLGKRFEIGQPVLCAMQGQQQISALRISAGARLLMMNSSKAIEITNQALNKITLLTRQFA